MKNENKCRRCLVFAVFSLTYRCYCFNKLMHVRKLKPAAKKVASEQVFINNKTKKKNKTEEEKG